MKQLALLLFLAAAIRLHAAPEYPKMGPDIYDPSADGAALISAALEKARAENKHVLLDLGANWCPWCRRLHRALTADPAVSAALHHDYLLVMIDVNTRHDPQRNAAIDQRYGHPLQHGLPVLLVLDARGHLLATQPTATLDDEHGQPRARLLEFLAKWTPHR